MNAMSLARLHEEFARAKKLCFADDASLVELLELWVPPEEDGKESKDKETPRVKNMPVQVITKGGNSCAPWRKHGGLQQIGVAL